MRILICAVVTLLLAALGLWFVYGEVRHKSARWWRVHPAEEPRSPHPAEAARPPHPAEKTKPHPVGGVWFGEFVELSDGGIIEAANEEGVIQRKDCNGNVEEVREPGDPGYAEWLEFFAAPVPRADGGALMRTGEDWGD